MTWPSNQYDPYYRHYHKQVTAKHMFFVVLCSYGAGWMTFFIMALRSGHCH